MVNLKSGVNEGGTVEFYLVGLENYGNLEIVLEHLQYLGVRVTDTLDGIYSRIATAEKDEITFKIIYHEDVGVYAFVSDQQSAQSNNWLEQILEQVVVRINGLQSK